MIQITVSPRHILAACALAALAGCSAVATPSAYVGQEARDVKALSAQEISDYLAGKGMGLAKAAELNGYPGPAHVLELASQLELTAQQRADTEALFGSMQARAMALGRELVEEERALDRLFASRAATTEKVEESLARIGRLQGRVRETHLDAHVRQAALLTPAQAEKYALLRGYGAAGGGASHEGHRGH